MRECHITFELLDSVYTDKASPERLLRRALRHLSQQCPVCHEEIRLFADERFDGRDLTRLDLSVLLTTIERWTCRLDLLRKQAQEEFEELMGLLPERRRGKISRATKRFRSPALADLLLEESRRQIFDHPKESFELAGLAHQVALQINVQRYGLSLDQELLVRSHAYKANAMRAQGNLADADTLMSWPLSRLSECADPMVLAEIYHLAAVLRRDQQRFDEALRYLSKALDTYREVGSQSIVGKVLISLAAVLRMSSRPEKALDAAREALSLLSVEREPQVYACARHNLALYLAEAGYFAEARKECQVNEAYYPLFPVRWLALRRSWLLGKIAAGLGESAEAERALEESKEGFIEERRAIDAALVSLDLALLYLEEGAREKIKHLAEEMLVIFRSHEIHREAVAAVILFQKAAQSDAVQSSLVSELATYLDRARMNPELMFRVSVSPEE